MKLVMDLEHRSSEEQLRGSGWRRLRVTFLCSTTPRSELVAMWEGVGLSLVTSKNRRT